MHDRAEHNHYDILDEESALARYNESILADRAELQAFKKEWEDEREKNRRDRRVQWTLIVSVMIAVVTMLVTGLVEYASMSGRTTAQLDHHRELILNNANEIRDLRSQQALPRLYSLEATVAAMEQRIERLATRNRTIDERTRTFPRGSSAGE